MRCGLAIAGPVVALCLAAAAAIAVEPVATCAFSGFSTDSDPQGTNIRTASRSDAAIAGRLPPRRTLESGDVVGPEFSILGSQSGWLLIENAAEADTGEEAPKSVFAGQGWVFGGLVGFTIGDEAMRAAPRADAKIVATLRGESQEYGFWGPDFVKVRRVFGCTGAFADAMVELPSGRRVRGWVTKLCRNQVNAVRC